MARLGRGNLTSSRIVRPARVENAAVSLGAFVTASSFPPLVASSPSIAISLPAFVTTSSFPAFELTWSGNVTLPTFVTTSRFPALSADAPILPGQLLTGPWQIEWARMVFGVAPYWILEPGPEGWDDLPEVDSGNAPRAARHGSWPGRDYAQQRTVSAVIAVSDDAGAFLTSRRDLRRVLNLSEDGSELDLVIRTDSETLRAKAKVTSRLMSVQHYGQQFTAVSVRWVAADPRRYDLQQQSVTVPADGTDYCVNDGDIATSPLIKINGPVVDPVIENETLGRILRFGIDLDDGEQLLVDTNAGTVLLDGADRMDALSSLSVPVEEWTLAAGTNRIAYTADSGGSNPIELLFSSAYM
ncbi:phage tail domain-containing protein [Sphaerisporangium sp. TRM90804]|uniref:phage distal tail protein n=1 Tax=Sphaerisporangium sp. TRM90804 TaxID=3031113 RepID=UPI0024494B9E|nr:phage tail domain-containing protein [Sphaerisporangium sp. TRM90804]MDH2424726.1 phage tail family protein [Sphaerisporangium sp. TRM90804]